MPFTFRTWMGERLVVAAILAASAWYGGARAQDWLTAVAVLLSFAHAQVADRLQEAEGARHVAGLVAVPCVGKLDHYWTAKEVLWAIVFLTSWNLPALVGCVALGAYPSWRRVWREIHPRQAA